MRIHGLFLSLAVSVGLAVMSTAVAAGPNDPSQMPLFVSDAAPALNMLVMGRDHKLYYEAYNDAADLDGDGVIDVGFKPEIKYYGYFNSTACYTYQNSRFEPTAAVSNSSTLTTADDTCTNAWSGNFLNYLATSRMDALRKVLYGGYRVTDTTSETVLRAAFIPQDAHSWGKEYVKNNAYKIQDYAPLAEPGDGRRHLFAVTTLTDGGIPQLRVLTNTSFRIWNWVSIERPVAGDDCFNSSNNRVGCTTAGPPAGGWEIVPPSRFSNLAYATWKDSSGSPGDQNAMDSRFSNFTSTSSQPSDMCTNGAVSIASINSGSNISIPIKSGAPSGCGQDAYHTLISGTITVEETGTYTFAIAGDDAIDVKIDGTVVAGHYGAHGSDSSEGGLNSHSGSISLLAGTPYVIQVRQKEDGGDSNWTLYWKPSANNGGTSTMTNYGLDILACPASSAALREDICKAYPNHGTLLYKPTGLLHDFGENNRMYFGLLTGSYANNIAGGVLRSNMDSFTREVNAETGQYNAISDGIVSTIDKLRITGFNYGDHAYSTCGWITDGPITNYPPGKCSMWGNPVAEMMYETLRYFAGATSGRSEYSYPSDGEDTKSPLLLSAPTWKPPYAATANGGGGYKQCSKPVMTVISDINPSYDYKLPGSHWTSAVKTTSDPVTLTSLDVSTETDAIGAAEGIEGSTVFIGESNDRSDSAPTPKKINKLSSLRGLAPAEPSKQGTYYSAGVARFGAKNVIGGGNKVMTYAVALASPLPKIVFPVNGNTVTVVPFAKSVGGSGIDSTGNFQPTDQIVDFYVTKLANTGAADLDLSVNAGRPYAEFSINYEDVEQGADHDMDAIARYTLSVDPYGTLQIQLTSEYAAGGIDQYMGYVISGTTADGIYLEIKDIDGADVSYRLNTPAGELPGYCNPTSPTPMPSKCFGLPLAASRTFTPSSTAGAGLLNDPLWFAAKYGIPDRDPSLITGTPDNYFLVTNALTLKERLTKAFGDIDARVKSVTSPAVVPVLNADATDTTRSVYRTSYDVATWSGDLIKETNTPGQNSWKASEAMPAASSRIIKMANSSGSGLVDFTWDNVGARGVNGVYAGVNLQQALAIDPDNSQVLPSIKADGTLANTSDADKGQSHLGFVRGTETVYRKRDSLLGDIINSSPVVVEGAQYLAYLADQTDGSVGDYAAFATAQSARKGRIYVGANDGMLHGFDIATGKETFAFVPSAVIRNLGVLASRNYNQSGGLHQFYVDGTPVVRDVYIKNSSNASINNKWRTVLVGTLRAGGKSMFALDVTDPDNINLLWEFSEGDDLVTGETVSDMGYSFPTPTLARLHSGQWAVVTGNGYGSASGHAALLLIDIATGQLIRKLPVASSGANAVDNGLSSVRIADNNSDGFADYVYAGDLKGNLWRFDLINTARANPLTPAATPDSAATFKVSFGGAPLYVAKDGSATPQRQAITAPPSLVRHPSFTGYIVMFGTGRYFTQADKNSTDKVQTLYGIWDRQTRGEAASTTPVLDRSNLQAQQLKQETTESFGEVDQIVRVLSNDTVAWFDGTAGKYGWYLDLALTNAEGNLQMLGERVVDEMAARGQVLLFGTRTPDSDSCKAGLKGFTYGIDPFTGGRTRFNVFDLSKDGVINVSDAMTFGGTIVPPSAFETPAGGITLSNNKLFNTDGSERRFSTGPAATGRQSWQVIPHN